MMFFSTQMKRKGIFIIIGEKDTDGAPQKGRTVRFHVVTSSFVQALLAV